MGKKSDFYATRKLSATEASRTFSSLLDRVESGQRFLIRRRGCDVCEMGPVRVEARKVGDCLQILRERASIAPDADFAEDLRKVISSEAKEDRNPWGS